MSLLPVASTAGIPGNVFVSGVLGLIQIKQQLDEFNLRLKQRQQEEYRLPAHNGWSIDTFRAQALNQLKRGHNHLIQPGAEFGHLFVNPDPGDVLLDLNPGVTAEDIEDAVDYILRVDSWRNDVFVISPSDSVMRMDHITVLTLEQWQGESGGRLWLEFAQSVAGTVLHTASANAELLGLGPREATVLKAMTPAFNALLSLDPSSGAAHAGKSLVRAFLMSALDLAASDPDIITTDKKLKPLVVNVLGPLQQYVHDNPGLEFMARDKLQDFFRGPLAYHAMKTVNDNPDLFLKGSFARKKAAGAVMRTALGDYLANGPDDFDVSDVLSEKGAVRLMNTTLNLLERQPDMFFAGTGDAAEALRGFMSSTAGILSTAPSPFTLRGGLDAEIMSVALDAASELAMSRAAKGLGDHDWADTWTSVAQELVGSFTEGLKAGLGLNPDGTPAAPGSAAATGRFQRIVSKDMAVNLFQIVMGSVAEKPDLLMGDDTNQEVKAIVAGIAASIASDEFGLLRTSDWRKILGHTLTLTARNPGGLFSIDKHSPEGQIGVVLIQRVLNLAGENMQVRADGSKGMLFGPILAEAIQITLDAATKTVISAMDENSLRTHLAAFDDFVGMLDEFTTGRAITPEGSTAFVVRLGGEEWIQVFRHYVAHVLRHGPDHGVTETDILELLEIVSIELEPGAGDPVA